MTSTLSPLTKQKLRSVGDHFDAQGHSGSWTSKSYRRLLAHYYNLLIPADASVLEIGCGSGELLAHLNAHRKVGIDLSSRQIERAQARVPGATFHVMAGEALALQDRFDYIIISDTLNLAADAQAILEQAHTVCGPETKLIVNCHNTLWRPVLALGRALGLTSRQPASSWLSKGDVANLLQLADWQPIKLQCRLLFPLEASFLERGINRFLAPLLPWACLALFMVARPRRLAGAAQPPSVTVVIPARNEAGNIEAAVTRTPTMGRHTELIFIEGGSRDNTWDEILRVQAAYPDRSIRVLKQTGKGKGNAVREAFAVSQGDILMILDADLTMPPEDLPKFYHAVAEGRCDFANGCRLVYPMEDRAMQFLNMIANKFFGLAFSWLLGQPLKDTLCGTKVLRRSAYERIAANRSYFGEFDPFGDFDLLFGADRLNMRIADIPIRYRERTYGSTNIQRWKHGWLLLRMVFFAARRIKFV